MKTTLTGLGMAATAAMCAAMLTGCGARDDEDDDVASASVTSALQASQAGGLNQDLADVDAEAATDPSRAAELIARKRAGGLTPEGCMTRTKSAEGNAVHVVFANCTGPFGKMRLNGSADVSFELDAQRRLVAKIVGGKDLTANDRPLAYKATGTLEVHGDERTVTWHAEASGQTKRGKDYSRSTDVAVTVDMATRCLDASGVAKGTIGGFDLELTVDGLSVCENACPKRGSARASVKGPLGRERTLEVAFDGSDHAKVKTPRGKELSVHMACADGESAD